MIDKRENFSIRSLIITWFDFVTSPRGAYGIITTLLIVFLLSSIVMFLDTCALAHGGFHLKNPIENKTLILLEKNPNPHANILIPSLNTPLIIRKNYLLHSLNPFPLW